jgi:hypothetical protein
MRQDTSVRAPLARTRTPAGASSSRGALRLLREWTELHQGELRANWERAQARTPLASIEPLP